MYSNELILRVMIDINIMNWIKTSERLPGREKIPGTLIDSNRSANVLAFYNGDIRVLFYNHQHEYWDDENDSCFDCDNNDIEYWMPFPQKPELISNCLQNQKNRVIMSKQLFEAFKEANREIKELFPYYRQVSKEKLRSMFLNLGANDSKSVIGVVDQNTYNSIANDIHIENQRISEMIKKNDLLIETIEKPLNHAYELSTWLECNNIKYSITGNILSFDLFDLSDSQQKEMYKILRPTQCKSK